MDPELCVVLAAERKLLICPDCGRDCREGHDLFWHHMAPRCACCERMWMESRLFIDDWPIFRHSRPTPRQQLWQNYHQPSTTVS